MGHHWPVNDPQVPVRSIGRDDLLSLLADEVMLPPLLPAIAHLTGNMGLVSPQLIPEGAKLREHQAGLTPDQQLSIRQRAADALIEWFSSVERGDAHDRPRPIDDTDEQELNALMRATTGLEVGPLYLDLLREELAMASEDRRAPNWHMRDVAPGRSVRVAIAGAGMSGIVAAHRLVQAGCQVTLFEKNNSVGGTWLENQYPGCRVDVSNHLYSYSFMQRKDWPFYFSPQSELLQYFRTCADELGVTQHVEFATEIELARWDEVEKHWELHVVKGDHRTVEFADVFIGATGQLNRPRLPDIEGRDTFSGPSFHSARWDKSVDFTDKRVAVIGNGASAAQFIPTLAERAAQVDIFQRTPNWLVPNPLYHAEVHRGLQWTLDNVPGYRQWYRFWMFWRSAEGLLDGVRVDDSWPVSETSVSQENDHFRALLTEYMKMMFSDRPDLFDKLLPHYPPGAKRIVIDNGAFPLALRRDNVRVTTDPITRITPAGVAVQTNEGAEAVHKADAIIYATGFQASTFVSPMQVFGLGGAELNQTWAGTARAYLGITVPSFPNLFLMYGPNTNIVVNGSIIFFSECETNYIVEAVRLLAETGSTAINCRVDVHDAYGAEMDQGNARMAWGRSGVSTWYKSANGHIAQNWPFTLAEYWDRTRTVNATDYELIR